MATAAAEMTATELAASHTPAPTQGDTIESDTPTIETQALARTRVRLERNRDVYDGTEAIQAGGEQYLPRFKGESSRHYNARRTISAVFNGYARTIDAVVGIICEPEPELDGMPDDLVAMAENVSGDGKHLAVFTRDLVRRGMVDGYAGILTEYPRLGDPRLNLSKASLAATVALARGAPLDAADVKALGLRPYFILIKVDECLPIYQSVNGKETLVMFVRKETTRERKGRFGFTAVTRYRVYELRGGQVFYERWTVKDSQTVQDEGPTLMRNLTGIPWSPLPLGVKKGDHEYKPTLDDMAFLTLTHHRIATGILSLEENAFVPTKWRVGAPRDQKTGTYPELVIGEEEVIEIPMPPQGVTLPNPPVGHLSPPVDVLQPAMKSLDNCKAEMGAMGAAFLTPQPVQETATAHRMDATAEKASVSTVSRDTKDCLESAFGFAGQYIGKPAGSVKMNTDFVGEGINVDILTALITNYQSDKPIVTLEDVRTYLKTGQLPEDFDPADTLGVLALTAKLARDKANAQRDALANLTADPTDQATNPGDNA